MAYKDKGRKTAYQNEFIKQAYDRINLTVPKGQKEIIQEFAAAQGMSVNAYIQTAIQERMERDMDNGPFPTATSAEIAALCAPATEEQAPGVGFGIGGQGTE